MKIIENNSLSIADVGKDVELYGFVSKKRNLGGLIFIDLRDRSGIIQLVIKPEDTSYSIAETLHNEYVIKVNGLIRERESKNEKLVTGEIEVVVNNLEILNTALDVPFAITEDTTALEDTRLKYRYLDLRRSTVQNNLKMRHKITMATRNYLDSMGFWEIETPVLCKSTPEGARDYLVPSRVNDGKFYALPQSPQLFKQLLMVGGIEKYFQIAKCFRDEDLRADRQPEFTQIDIEASYVNEDDVMSIGEGLISHVFKEVKGIDIKLPLKRMTYNEAMKLYGCDKPDLRFDMVIQDITNLFVETDIPFFKSTIENKGVINCLIVKDCASKYSRKELDKLTDFVKNYKAPGLAYLKFVDQQLTGSVKGINDIEKENLISSLTLTDNDLVLIVCGNYNTTKISLGALRCKLGKDLNLIKTGEYQLLWVTDFPTFEYSEEEQRYVSCHHPFTSPKDSDVNKLISDQGNCYSKAYDMVINGYEAGGGSIRIHDQQIQSKVFEALGFTEEQIQEKFGFFVDALKYGTPPHGGMAFGLDRLTMLFTETDNIRDVIAFPKTASASCLMSEAPNTVSDVQLKELHIKVDK